MEREQGLNTSGVFRSSHFMRRFFNPGVQGFEVWSIRIMEMSLLASLFVTPWDYSIHLRNLFLVIGMIMWGLERFVFKKIECNGRHFLDKYILIYVGAIWVTVIFSTDVLLSARALRGDLSKFLLTYVLAVRVYTNEKAVIRLFWGLTASSMVVSVYAMLGYLYGLPGATWGEGQPLGPFGHYNPLGHYLALHLLIVVAVFINEKKYTLKFVALSIIPFQFMLLMLTRSRTSVVAFFIGIVSLLFLQRKVRSIFVFALILLTLAVGLSNRGLLERFKTVLDPAVYKSGMLGRKEIWRNTLSWVKEYPWLGHGYGVNMFLKKAKENDRPPWELHAHNLYIQILFESGILGLVAYLLLFFMAAGEAFWLRKRSTFNTVLFPVFVLIFFLGMTEVFFLEGRFGVYLWTGFALVSTVREHSPESLALAKRKSLEYRLTEGTK